MFTFGRQREKEAALRYLRDPAQSALVHDVVDAVHDLLESCTTVDAVRIKLSRAFVDGGSGVWEQTGSWIRKLGAEHPQLQSAWRDFASHPDSKVRFRAACFVDEMPLPLAIEIGTILKDDRSKKVREMAQARLEEIQG